MTDRSREAIHVDLAPGVGRFIAEAVDGALLCVCLSQGVRGVHSIVVYDTARAFEPVATFEVPNPSASGITPIAVLDGLLLSADARSLSAYRVRTGEPVWQRAFERPMTFCSAHVSGFVLLVHTGASSEVVVVRASDGAIARALTNLPAPSVFPCGVGPGGDVVQALSDRIQISTASGETIVFPIALGVSDGVCFDDLGERVVCGTRDGELVVADLARRTAERIRKFDGPIRTAGALPSGAVWAIDREGWLRTFAMPSATPILAVDLAVDNVGASLDGACAWVAIGDTQTGKLHVRALPSGKELFATKPGFSIEAVALGAEGALYVAGPEALLRIAPDSCTVTKVGPGARFLRRLARGGVLAGAMSGVRLVSATDTKPTRLGSGLHRFQPSPDATRVALAHGAVVRVVSLENGTEIAKWDLRRVGFDPSEGDLDGAFLAPDGDVLVLMSNGEVRSASRFDAPPLYRFPSDTRLAVASNDGQSLLRVSGQEIERVRLGDWSREVVGTSAMDSALTSFEQSPSGRLLTLFHRNGRFAVLDLERGAYTPIATPITSAAERGSTDTHAVDLDTPDECAFSADEHRVILVASGRLVFADVATGELSGSLVVPTDGRSCVVTDGRHLSWTGTATRAKASGNAGPSPEIRVSLNGAPIDAASLASRRRPDVLRALLA